MNEHSKDGGISKEKVFEMYLEGAKWLLAIIAGLLVYGLDRLTAHPVTGWPLWLFAGSSAFLGISAAAALYYLLRSFAYASTAAQQASATATSADTGVSANLPDRDEMYKRIGTAFGVMIWSFSVGGALYLAFGLQQILTIRKEPETRIEATEQGVFYTQGGHLWSLRNGRAGPTWVRLPDVPREGG
jgi:hypothetical protein